MDVLTVGEVRGVTSEVAGNLADGANTLGGGLATIETNAEHKVLVLQLGVSLHTGVLTAKPLLALGVEANPLKARS